MNNHQFLSKILDYNPYVIQYKLYLANHTDPHLYKELKKQKFKHASDFIHVFLTKITPEQLSLFNTNNQERLDLGSDIVQACLNYKLDQKLLHPDYILGPDKKQYKLIRDADISADGFYPFLNLTYKNITCVPDGVFIGKTAVIFSDYAYPMQDRKLGITTTTPFLFPFDHLLFSYYNREIIKLSLDAFILDSYIPVTKTCFRIKNKFVPVPFFKFEIGLLFKYYNLL